MKFIERGLFSERKEKVVNNNIYSYFSDDLIQKILVLMRANNYSDEPFPSVYRPGNRVLDLLCAKIVFLLPFDKFSAGGPDQIIDNIYKYILKHKELIFFIDVIELYCRCLFEITKNQQYYYFNFLGDLNSLLELNNCKFYVTNEGYSPKMLSKDSPIEEHNKAQVYVLLRDDKFEKVNEHFNKSLIEYSRKTNESLKESIEQSCLALEKYLKIINNNQNLDAPHTFTELKKKSSTQFRGIFRIYPDLVGKKIDDIYTIRSKIKSHSSEDKFDENEFLDETARFQINEVMNCILLINDLLKT